MTTPRYEREIRSILDGISDFPGDYSSHSHGIPPRNRQSPRSLRVQLLSTRDALLLAGALVIFARFGGILIGAGASFLLGIVAAFLVIYGILLAFTQALFVQKHPHMWRGRVIDYPRSTVPPWWSRLQRWFRPRY
ncbi:MAG: hypothetical protein M1298_02020 [Chloroflexi bacterium]|nr:hypothetical protein [Chloroflexota bacterium]